MRSCLISAVGGALRAAWIEECRAETACGRPAATRLSLTERISASPSVLRLSGISAMPRRAATVGPAGHWPAVEDRISPAGHGVGAEDRARDLGAAGADQAAQADDLAGAHGQIDVARCRSAR